jgi:hypothetical protein
MEREKYYQWLIRAVHIYASNAVGCLVGCRPSILQSKWMRAVVWSGVVVSTRFLQLEAGAGGLLRSQAKPAHDRNARAVFVNISCKACNETRPRIRNLSPVQQRTAKCMMNRCIVNASTLLAFAATHQIDRLPSFSLSKTAEQKSRLLTATQELYISNRAMKPRKHVCVSKSSCVPITY